MNLEYDLSNCLTGTHVLGINETDQELHFDFVQGDSFPLSPPDFKFFFCPLCGKRLVSEQEISDYLSELQEL